MATAERPLPAVASAPALDLVGRSGRSPREAASWTRRQSILTNLRAIRGRAYPRYTGLFREKSWVFFEILLPFLSTSAFVFVYRALHAPEAYVDQLRDLRFAQHVDEQFPGARGVADGPQGACVRRGRRLHGFMLPRRA